MLNFDRMKFAYARGARIEFKVTDDRWGFAKDPLWSCLRPSQWRVHPKDEHLLYGPLTSALRDSVMYVGEDAGQGEWDWLIYDCQIQVHGEEWEWPDGIDPIVSGMYTLFCAEALADMGV